MLYQHLVVTTTRCWRRYRRPQLPHETEQRVGVGRFGSWSLAVVLVLLSACTAVPEGRGGGELAQPSTSGADTTVVRQTPETVPLASPDSCSAQAPGVVGLLTPEDGLPDPVAVTRAAVFQAAKSCDWTALRELARGTFLSNAPTDKDPVSYWKEFEEQGEDVLLSLVEILNRPSLRFVERDGSFYYWPSPFTEEGWYVMSVDDRLAIRPLDNAADFRLVEETGAYDGYRVGISEDGSWFAFLRGP